MAGRDAEAEWIDTAGGVRAEYFANSDLRGAPAYTRVERDILFDWGAGSPGPWVPADDFSARFSQTLTAGLLGRWLNFAVDADDHVRVRIDGATVLEPWDGGNGGKFTKYLGRGEHELVVEYRERSGDARLLLGSAVWPATPVFAAEDATGSFEQLPASAADYVTATPQQVAGATPTPTPRSATPTPTPPSEQALAAANGEPYRDESATVLDNDGFFATVEVTAWFRPSRHAPWEERQAAAECRLVGDAWQCDRAFAFALSQGEQARRAQATATAVASRPPVWTEPTTGMTFVRVPAGEFTMGSSEEEIEAARALCLEVADAEECSDTVEFFTGAETPQHQVYLDEYWIGQTEVTNAQYRIFVEAGGYDESSYWTDSGWQWRQDNGATEPSCWDDDDFNWPDHPVVCVSWYEAVAYTRWLAAATGAEFRLPSEAEWEKAARGTDGRIFPWGDEWDGGRLNSCDVNCPNDNWKDEAVDDGYAYTAPVGSYPDGASSHGALDMAGNVWEWTSTAYGGCDWPGPGTFGYPYAPDDGREELEGSDCRSLRNGSWKVLTLIKSYQVARS